MKQVQDGDTRNFDLGAKKQSTPIKKKTLWKPCPHNPGYVTDGVHVCRKEDVPQ